MARAISKVESSDNYTAIGPATRSGDRAIGRYQVMSQNVPTWTKEVLGVALTPKQFLSSPQAQDAVAIYKLQQYYNKHGNHGDAAAMWFSGRPMKGNRNNDLYTSVPQYVSKTAKHFNNIYSG